MGLAHVRKRLDNALARGLPLINNLTRLHQQALGLIPYRTYNDSTQVQKISNGGGTSWDTSIEEEMTTLRGITAAVMTVMCSSPNSNYDVYNSPWVPPAVHSVSVWFRAKGEPTEVTRMNYLEVNWRDATIVDNVNVPPPPTASPAPLCFNVTKGDIARVEGRYACAIPCCIPNAPPGPIAPIDVNIGDLAPCAGVFCPCRDAEVRAEQLVCGDITRPGDGEGLEIDESGEIRGEYCANPRFAQGKRTCPRAKESSSSSPGNWTALTQQRKSSRNDRNTYWDTMEQWFVASGAESRAVQQEIRESGAMTWTSAELVRTERVVATVGVNGTNDTERLADTERMVAAVGVNGNDDTDYECVWRVRASLRVAQDFVLRSIRKDEETRLVMQRDGVILMADRNLGQDAATSSNTAGVAGGAGMQEKLVLLSQVRAGKAADNNGSSVASRLHEEIAIRYPTLRPYGSTSARAAAVLPGEYSGKHSGSRGGDTLLYSNMAQDMDYWEAATIGFNVESKPRIDIYTALVQDDQFVPSIDPTSARTGTGIPWFIFSGVEEFQRQQYATFRQTEVFTLVVAFSALILFTYIVAHTSDDKKSRTVSGAPAHSTSPSGMTGKSKKSFWFNSSRRMKAIMRTKTAAKFGSGRGIGSTQNGSVIVSGGAKGQPRSIAYISAAAKFKLAQREHKRNTRVLDESRLRLQMEALLVNLQQFFSQTVTYVRTHPLRGAPDGGAHARDSSGPASAIELSTFVPTATTRVENPLKGRRPSKAGAGSPGLGGKGRKRGDTGLSDIRERDGDPWPAGDGGEVYEEKTRSGETKNGAHAIMSTARPCSVDMNGRASTESPPVSTDGRGGAGGVADERHRNNTIRPRTASMSALPDFMFVSEDMRRQALDFVLDAFAGMNIFTVLSYDAMQRYPRIWAYRLSVDPFYKFVMIVAVVVHCSVSFMEAPSPVILAVYESRAMARAQSQAAMNIAAICIVFHCVDALIMCAGEGWKQLHISTMMIDADTLGARGKGAFGKRHRPPSEDSPSGYRKRISVHVFIYVFITVLFVVDIICQAATHYNEEGSTTWVSGHGGDESGTRAKFRILFPVTAVFRPLLLAVRSLSIRNVSRNFLRTVVSAAHVFLLLFLIVLFAAIIGLLLLSRRLGDGFRDILDSIIYLFVYMATAENYPDMVYKATKCPILALTNGTGGNDYVNGGCDNALFHLYVPF